VWRTRGVRCSVRGSLRRTTLRHPLQPLRRPPPRLGIVRADYPLPGVAVSLHLLVTQDGHTLLAAQLTQWCASIQAPHVTAHLPL
jgi:hypothetical protein